MMNRSISRLFLTALLLVLVGAPEFLTAQQPGPAAPNPGVPTPGAPATRPTLPARRPGSALPGGPVPGGGQAELDGPIEAPPATEDLLKNGILMPTASIIKVVLPTYQQLTGKRVILDTNIADNNVRVVVNGPITKPDLVDFIERTLLLNGFAFVPTNKENTVKLINASGGLPLRAQGGSKVYTKETPLPETDQVITYVMTLDFIKAEEAVRIFPQIIQLNSYGALASVPNASAIVIYEDVAIIRQLVELKALVDVSSGQVKSRWFELERADAEKAAEFLMEVLENKDDSGGVKSTRAATGAQPAPQGGAPTPPPTGGSGQPGAAGGAVGDEAPAIKIVADTRRNSVLAVARPLDLTYIESLIKEYDSPSKARTFLKRSLQFITATEFLPLVSDALSKELGDDSSSGTTGGTSAGAGSSQNRQTNATRTGSGSTRNTGSSSGFGGSSGSGGFGGGSGGSGSSSSGLSDPSDTPMAESVVIGKTLIVADNERNSIIVSGPPESIRLVEELIDQLDLRPRQVYLSTVIGQITLGNDKEFGVNVVRAIESLNNREEFLGSGSLNSNNMPADGDGNLLDLGTLTDITKFPATDGLNLYGKIAGNMDMYIKMLETSSRFKVLQRPSIYTANNRKAVIQSGQRIAVPTNSFQSGATSGTTQSTNIEYRDVVLKLEVVPLINSENEVTLQVSQLNDNVIGTQTIDGNELPIIGTQEVLTTVTVTNGQTVVLGGLITERTERTINGVPVLIQIPIIKHLFGTTNDKKKREELLIFIQPKILDTSEQILDSHISEIKRTQGGDDVFEFAVPDYAQKKQQLINEGKLPEEKKKGFFRRFKLFGE